MQNPLLEAALGYAARGWPVLPLHTWTGKCSCGDTACSSPAKHPRTGHGLTDATLDPKVIADWWRRWPDSNVGVRCDQLCVLDLDGPGAAIALEEHALDADLHGCTTQTGVGRHLLFEGHPEAKPRSKVLPDLDIRAGAGSYIVAPPSVHWTGAVYEWRSEDPPPPLPAAIRAVLGFREGGGAQATVRDPGPPAGEAGTANGRYDAVTAVAEARKQGLLGVGEGQRHHTLLRLVGKELATGLFTFPELAAHALLWASMCTPAMPEAEALRIVVDLWRSQAAQHGGDPLFDYGDGKLGGEAGKAELDLVPIDDLRSARPVAWSIKGVVPVGLVIVYAEPNVGKSLLVQSWCFAAAAEQSWMGCDVRAGASMLLVSEGRRGLWKRVAAWDHASPGSKRVHQVLVGNLPDLTDAGERRKLEAAVVATRPTWLGIDTLTDAVGAADENSSTELKVVLAFLARLADQHELTVVLVHHANKDILQQGLGKIRGTTAIAAKVDAAFMLEANTDGVVMRCTKQREDEKAGPIGLKLLPVDLGNGERGVTLVPMGPQVRDTTADRVIDILDLAESAGCTVAQLVTELRIVQSNVQRALAPMVANGTVVSRIANRKTGARRYWLTRHAPIEPLHPMRVVPEAPTDLCAGAPLPPEGGRGPDA